MPACGRQRFLQRVGRVRIIDDHRRLPVAAQRFHASGNTDQFAPGGYQLTELERGLEALQREHCCGHVLHREGPQQRQLEWQPFIPPVPAAGNAVGTEFKL